MPTPRVLLVDDSPGFLESAAHFLSAENWLQVVGSGLSGRAGSFITTSFCA